MRTKLVNVQCPLCKANNYTILYTAKIKNEQNNFEYFKCTNNYLGKYGNNIVKCNICSMIFANPQLDHKQLLSIYKNIEDPTYLDESEARIKTYNYSIGQLLQYIKPPGNLLDIGCYTGVFMEVAKKNGWNVSGIELSTWASNIARKKNIGTIYNTPFEKISLTKESFDIITMWDVIEHLSKPKETLIHAEKLLRPEGILALSTHMIDSLSAKILGKKYPFLMDMHLSHFSHFTIKKILNEVGLEIIKISPHNRILRAGYFLDKLSTIIPFGKAFIMTIKKSKLLSNRYISINLLGLKNIYCKKIL